MSEDESTQEERQAADARLKAAAFSEILAYFETIAAREVAGTPPFQRREMRVELTQTGGPIVVLPWDDVSGHEVGVLMEVAGQNLDLKIEGGRIVVYCPSWPDEEPVPF